MAYVAQQAWIQNLTVRDNISFGKAMDQRKYQNIVEACELKEDFEMLPAGDMTEIGEKVSFIGTGILLELQCTLARLGLLHPMTKSKNSEK